MTLLSPSTSPAESLDLSPRPDMAALTNRLRFSPAFGIKENLLAELVKLVRASSQPVATYRACRLTTTAPGFIEIDALRFENPLIRVNMAQASHVFPFALTMGHDYVKSISSKARENYVIDIIKRHLFETAVRQTGDLIARRFHMDYIWSLIAGEMEAWPQAGNRQVLSLLAGAHEKLGITLKSDDRLQPDYSCCGLFYYMETEFEGCQVCPREPCMMRRAQYNAELASKPGLRIRKVCGKDTA